MQYIKIIKKQNRRETAVPIENNNFYQLEEGYHLSRQNGNKCIWVLKNDENVLICKMEYCGERITYIETPKDKELSKQEKKILYRFIMKRRLSLSKEAAAVLDLSIIKYADHNEEKYLQEKQLKKLLKQRLSNVKIYVSKLQSHTIKIAEYSKNCVYNLSQAKIKKLVIENNCDALIDLRDNTTIENLRIKENFSGGINMSRNSIKSIEIENNCRCDITLFDSINCFNLAIGDVYSGNLNIKNSCFHAISIGYYCYASITLSQNWGRREIQIGDSFRGGFVMDNVSVYGINIGKDCKGQINISSNKPQTLHNLVIGDDFAGTADLSEDTAIKQLQVGKNARGRFNLIGCPSIKIAKFDKYFKGHADFSESAVEYVSTQYGSGGEFIFIGCEKLNLVELPRERLSHLEFNRSPLSVSADNWKNYYHFSKKELPKDYFVPFYSKVVNGIKELWQ